MNLATSAVFNLANAAIGAGVLGFPYAFKQSGLVFGPLLALGFGILMYALPLH